MRTIEETARELFEARFSEDIALMMVKQEWTRQLDILNNIETADDTNAQFRDYYISAIKKGLKILEGEK